MIVVLAAALVVAVLIVLVALKLYYASACPSDLEQLGVKPTYPKQSLPVSKIESYCELKERMRGQYGRDSDGDEIWMSQLPLQAKDLLKYRLMQRAIGDVAAFHKVEADARGYWKLFSKGLITRRFWNSVVEAERELSQEFESVKTEASCVEPGQDPQGIIREAMQFIWRYGDKLPSADPAGAGGDALTQLLRYLPPPGHPQGQPPLQHPQGGPAPPLSGGSVDDAYSWRQEADEIEVSVSVPNNATKAEVKVSIQSKVLRVEHCGTVLVEGQLAQRCQPQGSTWTMGRGRVVVSLEKAEAQPWPSLFGGKT